MVRLIALLLIAEGASSGYWITTLVPRFGGFDAIVDVVLALRALVAAAQVAGGIALRARRPVATPLAQSALIASAVLMVFEVGARIAPSNLTPSLRVPVVAAYAIYAAFAAWALQRARRRDRRESSFASKAPARPLGLDEGSGNSELRTKN